MEAGIIVCAYNRAESPDTINALRAKRYPSSLSWEVIIVDNNFRDRTRKLVEEAQSDWLPESLTRQLIPLNVQRGNKFPIHHQNISRLVENRIGV